VKTLTQSGHPFIREPQRRFAPITVRYRRNAVRHGSEQVYELIGIRINNRENSSGVKLLKKRPSSATPSRFQSARESPQNFRHFGVRWGSSLRNGVYAESIGKDSVRSGKSSACVR
jgi:hypothetical protein